MNVSSLRALLLALAMVLQTIAGVARAASADAGAALLLHCESKAVQDDKAAGGGHSRHHHCDACSLCAAPSSVYVPDGGPFLILPVEGQRVVSRVPDDSRIVATAFSPNPPARGPPSSASGC
ncbi:MAG: DUF2946 family protein [Hyphomicrobiales bacterium]